MNGFENKMISEMFVRDNKLLISLPINSLLVENVIPNCVKLL